MSVGINKVILIGHVGKEPDCKKTSSDLSIASFSMATGTMTKDKVEKTEWHNVKAFGKLADIIQNYVRKGSKIYIEGSLSTSKYTDKEGIERWSTCILANSMQMLDSKKSDEQQVNDDQPIKDFMDDEIPF